LHPGCTKKATKRHPRCPEKDHRREEPEILCAMISLSLPVHIRLMTLYQQLLAAPTLYQTLPRPGLKMNLRSTGLHEDIQQDLVVEAETRTILEKEIFTQLDLDLMIRSAEAWALALAPVAGECIPPLMIPSSVGVVVKVAMIPVYHLVLDMIL
jgi:hypothetical protein